MFPALHDETLAHPRTHSRHRIPVFGFLLGLLKDSIFDDLHFALGEDVDDVGQPVLIIEIEHLVLVVDDLVDVDGHERVLEGEDPEGVGPRELIIL